MSFASIYCTRAEAKAAIFEYIEDFDNRQRHHSGFRHRVQNPKTGIRRYDLEDGRIGSIIILSENRDEVHGGVAEDGDATQSHLLHCPCKKLSASSQGFINRRTVCVGHTQWFDRNWQAGRGGSCCVVWLWGLYGVVGWAF